MSIQFVMALVLVWRQKHSYIQPFQVTAMHCIGQFWVREVISVCECAHTYTLLDALRILRTHTYIPNPIFFFLPQIWIGPYGVFFDVYSIEKSILLWLANFTTFNLMQTYVLLLHCVYSIMKLQVIVQVQIFFAKPFRITANGLSNLCK